MVQCQRCKKVFKWQWELERHMRRQRPCEVKKNVELSNAEVAKGNAKVFKGNAEVAKGNAEVAKFGEANKTDTDPVKVVKRKESSKHALKPLLPVCVSLFINT